MKTDSDFKNEEVRLVHEKFAEQVEPLFLKYFNEKIKEQTRFIRAYDTRYQKMFESFKSADDIAGMVELQRDFNKSMFELLMKNSETLSENSFDEYFQEFEETISNITKSLKKTLFVKHKKKLFPVKWRDNPYTFTAKAFANTRFVTGLQSKNLLNRLRILFKKQPVELVAYRRRRIPYRNMAYHFMMNQFMAKAREPLNLMMKSKSDSLLKLWQLNEKIDDIFSDFLQNHEKDNLQTAFEALQHVELIENLRSGQQTLLSNIKGALVKHSEEAFKTFDKEFPVVDTLELSAGKFHQRRIESELSKHKQTFDKAADNWKNTHFTLFDDWAVDVEITLLYYSVYVSFIQMTEAVDHFVNNDISKAFKGIRSFITTAKKQIDQSGSSKKEVRDSLHRQRAITEKELIDKTLAQTVELLSSCFDDDFERLLTKTLQIVEKVSDKRAFIRSKSYQRGVTRGEMNWISPRELLNFEALPVFRKNVGEVKNQVDKKLEKARVHLLGLGTVCDFSLESAMVMMQQNEGTTKKAVETALSGFDRALLHLGSVQEIIGQIQHIVNSDLSKAINSFNNDVLKLKNTENIFELNLKIARIKAVEKSKEFKKSVTSAVRQIVPKFIVLTKQLEFGTIRLTSDIRKRMGFAPEVKHTSFELSEFIGQTQVALKRLPYVYQRLYQLNPADEDRFFVNRKKEVKHLGMAMENWKKDRFITVAVLGIKGSGITSLINYFLRHNKTDLKLIRRTLNQKIHLPGQYFDFFSELFDGEKFETNKQIVDHVNASSTGNQIIVLENLHHMFLKRVHGFDCMNMFFDLMSNTMKKVLWIGAYTLHSWEYLEKTIHISNYFTNEIYMEALDAETISEIIFKRNRLSGYQIIFQPGPDNLVSKSFAKLSDDEKQQYLHKQFFGNLSNISAGNITLAQLYWLRSTRKVSDETIEIGVINEIDFTFVKTLQGDELFAMQAILQHDGLTLEEFSLVMGKPENAARNMLVPMLEKGLLIRPKQKFNINPIIFKPVVNYLASRNFIN
jgi:hypothetical protein